MYGLKDINDWTKYSDAPIEISIPIRNKKSINFHCGKTHLTKLESKDGWCATRQDKSSMFFDLYIFI